MKPSGGGEPSKLLRVVARWWRTWKGCGDGAQKMSGCKSGWRSPQSSGAPGQWKSALRSLGWSDPLGPGVGSGGG